MILLETFAIEATKTVSYYGITLQVPTDVKYLTTDEDGTVCGWGGSLPPETCTGQPQGEGIWCESWMECGYLLEICSVDLEGVNWKNTLVEV